MAKREKIILLIMGIAIVAGILNFFISFKKTNILSTDKKISEVNQFVSDLTPNIAKGELSKAQKYVIEKASTEWTKDPFLIIDVPEPKKVEKAEVQEEKYKFIYSGYVNFGDRKLAIINGLEYETGDELVAKAGYIVKSISPNQVEIGVNGGIRNIILSLEEKSILPSGTN